MQLEGKVALVTGASKGIGEAIARRLGKHGAKVVVSSRKQEAVEQVANDFRKEGIVAAAFACNTGIPAELEQLVQKTAATFRGIDILVNNAGTNPSYGPAETLDLKAFDKTLEVNLRGPFYLSQLVYPLMKARNGGSIINISSVEGITPSEQMSAYCMSKAGLNMATKVMAKEWGKDGIRVNAICPGYIKTKLSQSIWSDEENLQKVLNHQILPHIGEPDDLSGIVLLLASNEGAYFTGSIISVDGGYTV